MEHAAGPSVAVHDEPRGTAFLAHAALRAASRVRSTISGFGHDTQLDRLVAIKVLRGGPDVPQAESDRFLGEARRLARLNHPGIVAIPTSAWMGGQVYIVSDFLRLGPDLGRWLGDHHPGLDGGGPDRGRRGRRLAHALPGSSSIATSSRPTSSSAGPWPRARRLWARARRCAGRRHRTGRHLRRRPTWHRSKSRASRRIDGRTDISTVWEWYSADALRPLAVPSDQYPRTAPPGEQRRASAPASAPGRDPAELERACLKAAREALQDRYTTAADFAEDLRRTGQSAAGPASSLWPTHPAEVPTGEAFRACVSLVTAVIPDADVVGPSPREAEQGR